MTRRRHLKLWGRSAALVSLSAWGTGNIRAAKSIGIAEFNEKFGVPGLSVAIAKEGKIVRREAYGFADLEAEEKLGTDHRFRIASVSKPITSVAIYFLVERGLISLDDEVFGEGGLLELGKDREVLKGITVRHLLTHTSGGWKNDRGDPMFRNPEWNHADLIKWTLENMPPEHPPGDRYAYSNFGYCLLGRVIEKVTGRDYGHFVRESILKSCGVPEMEIGGNTESERLEREVRYYMGGKKLDSTMNVRRMDAHGGWVGTPSEMVEFALRVDGFGNTPDILKDESIAAMTKGGAVNAGYASGWSVNKAGNRWHGGSLPGLTSLLVRTSDGFCWAACANTRAKGIGLALDRLMWRLRREI